MVPVVGLIIASGSSVYFLRANNLKMIELRQAVYDADKNNGDVETALNQLRQFVYVHMNTSLRTSQASSEPPIQLENRFKRAVAAEQARVAALGTANQVYIEAQNQCETSSIPLTARAQCIQNYVSDHGQGIPELNLPPKEFYTFDFASPWWSPDPAGWSLVMALLFSLLLITRLLTGMFIKSYIKK